MSATDFRSSSVLGIWTSHHRSPMPVASRMRREPAEAERRLWGALRNRALGGFKFVRQAPVGPYVADFFNREHRLIVEVDGPSHGEDRAIAHDNRRTAWLAGLEIAVHRVGNSEIFSDIGAVLDGIHAALTERAKGTSSGLRPPSPLPWRRDS